MDFLPDGDLIFGEKRGKLYRKSNGTVTEITGFPTVPASGQGGLLDISVHPDYAANGWIYSSYSETNPGGGGQLRLIRFKINNNQVQNIENLFTTNGSNTWNGHYGSRIVFGNNKHVYLSVGEGGSGSYGGTNASNKFKDWKGNLLVCGLASHKLYRCVIDNNKVTSKHIIPGIDGRVRNVIQAPDGSVYVSVENPGRIIQILPGD